VDFDRLRSLRVETSARIVLLVLDGLGGLPLEPGGPTELEAAKTPNLDALAAQSSLGLIQHVGPGITPGSGPGHLALFGYDPLRYLIGRGVLEALGIGFPLGANDLAARGNFCTVDTQGRITDRRAGRIPTAECARRCEVLRQIRLPGVELFVEPVQDYRFLLVLRGEGLSADLNETDPQRVGVPPLPARAQSQEAGRSAQLVNQFVAEAGRLLEAYPPANMVTLRGWARHPDMPTMSDVFGVQPAAIALYPMYKGLAKLVGMEILPVTGSAPGHSPTIADEFATLAANWDKFNFFYIHIKYTDSAGEDGDFARKASIISEVDQHLPRILDLKPAVLLVTGDHSTPALLKSHSWHPVPFLLYSRTARPDGIAEFGERACARGSLGLFPASQVMPLALAHALALAKYGA